MRFHSFNHNKRKIGVYERDRVKLGILDVVISIAKGPSKILFVLKDQSKNNSSESRTIDRKSVV